MGEQYVGIAEVAKMLGVSESWVYKAVRKHGLPAYKVGGNRRFRISEIEAWIVSNREVSEVPA